MPRLFTAIEIPRDAALCLSFLRGGLPSARWIDTENYHLTLRFIGDVDCRTADEVVAELDRVARPSFELTLRGVGAFGSKKPHSIYAGAVPSPGLDTLQADVDRACRRAGIAPNAQKFVPHVTLARLRHPKGEDVARYLSGRGNFRSPSFQVGRFVLYSSRDSVGGGPYLLEEAFKLGEPVSRRAPEHAAVPA
ncbi:RNA 2',3'-cyclic phosphodiesterase [Aureimonas sp. OT7]|uniref:RNA 2',3'-cyclic phosphodiesterase n=1 Tax=Aureimonas sp. OT7 TaxID=2816454 RepID=UPI00177D47AB|nr:RNA 2',3'-cyclic phosphodiesterase [Aureimonas sp. OT7]QOG07532.1 RNA 2',3'-cyclic phosphodiesterase [Aureimonas sp. OT7]